MEISNILSLAGGLGCFLFGMKYMGEGLEQAAGQKMRDLLEALTRNKIIGFLLGLLVTCVIQSSSATTVMVMGFINASIMDLAQATSVIFGANLGTTITSILIALDVSEISPFCIFVGAVMMLYAKKNRTRRIGQVILGFGILFQGLHTMSGAMAFLKEYEPFQNFIISASNPVLGLLIGILMAAVIQSSSAAVGVLQALAMQGLMPIYFASFLVCGINIGSSMPPILSALNARNNAKRAAAIYTIFNVVGALIFVPITIFTPYTSLISQVIANEAFQISFLHIFFKVVAAAVLLPLTQKVVDLAFVIIPKQEHESEFRFLYIDKNLNAKPEVEWLQLGKEMERMAQLVRDNYTAAVNSLLNHDLSKAEQIKEDEKLIDYLNHAMTDYLVDLTKKAIHTNTSKYLNKAMHVISDLERIGDYSVFLIEKAEYCSDNSLVYSEEAKNELEEIYTLDLNLFDRATKAFFERTPITQEEYNGIKAGFRHVRELSELSEKNHVIRLQNNKCSTESGLIYVKALTDMEKVGDHCYQIARAAKADFN